MAGNANKLNDYSVSLSSLDGLDSSFELFELS